MRKPIVLLAFAVGVFAVGASDAVAAGPYCIQLNTFCDQMTVWLDLDDNVWGLWDWRCDGTDNEEMLGDKDTGKATVAGYIAGINFTESWRVDISGRTVTVYAWDGVSDPRLLGTDGITISGGACTSTARGARASINAR